MSLLMEELNLTIPEYSSETDPSKRAESIQFEWTIPDREVKRMRSMYENNCCKARKKVKTKSENDICSSETPKKLKLSNGEKELTDIKAEVSAETDSGGSRNGTTIKKEANEDLALDAFSDNSSLLEAGFSNSVVKNEIISC